MPSRASSRIAIGCDESFDASAIATQGPSAERSACAARSWPVPVSPRIRIGRRAASSVSSARSVSRTGARVPIAASDTRRGSRAAALRSAREIVPSSLASPIGFSRKSNAPTLVASTAVSIVPWPDIITTGIVSRPQELHSRSSVTPSVSGIQMSSSTSAGSARAR